MSQNIIETKQVTKIYDSTGLNVKAVDEVSIRVKAGEFVGLVGPSGSGKTTMLAMLATLLRETDGQLLIDGQDLGSMSDRQRTKFRREKIGFTFQANNLVPYLTALENVELMLRLNNKNEKECRARAKELLTRLGLEDRLNNLPAQLSGGQQQRVAIARALIHDPSVVLADEPTASLDTERANQVVGIFADLIHEEKRAGIMVTHDLRMMKYVDKVIQMVDGRIERVITDRADINLLAGTSEFDRLKEPVDARQQEGYILQKVTPNRMPTIMFSGAGAD
jgi:putative ABC transport system ATP-binding protein